MSTAKKVVAKKPAQHPPYGDMVKMAIRELKERKGSSRQAIIKYIRANFKIAATENVESFVRRSLVAGVKAGRFVHTKGTGASGSFKLPEKATPKKAAKPKKVKTPKKSAPKKKTTPKAKTAKPKKTATPKRAGAKKTVKKVSAKKVAKK